MAGSGKGVPPAGAKGAESVEGVGGTDAVRGAEEVEALDRVGEVKAARAAEVGAVRGVAGATASSGADAIAEVAAALRAGELTVAEAVDRLIDDAVTRRVGRALEPGGELEARLRRVLRDYASADPLITAKIRRLEGRRPGR